MDLIRIISIRRSIGFVKNAGVHLPWIGVDHWRQTRKFFNLPVESKQSSANPPGPHPQRGWSGPNVEQTANLREAVKRPGQDLKDAKEHMDIGPANDVEFPNRWPHPTELAGFRDFMEDYYSRTAKISLMIMSALEVGLNLPRGLLIEPCVPHAGELRLNHYPAVEIQELRCGNTRRIWPHTDFGIISLLFQDHVGGLEIEDRENPGTFRPLVRQNSTELTVNVSDTLMRWTNNVLPAGVHQVTLPANAEKGKDEMWLTERYSIVFFLKASRHALVGPMAPFVGPQQPPLYEHKTALEFQQLRTQILYAA